MPESFELTVWYTAKELMLPAEMQAGSTSHRMIVYIEDFPFTFEPDEKGITGPCIPWRTVPGREK